MKTLIAHLRLSTNLDGHTRERCPDVVFTFADAEIVAIRTDIEVPTIPLPETSIDRIVVHDDALSRVIDEEAWLHELERVLAPGGTLQFTVPKAGALAWLDAMDAHRYAVDIGKRGDAPNGALPTGWNRHYTQQQISLLCIRAGFDPPRFATLSYARAEAAMIVGLFVRNWIGGDRDAEPDLWPRYRRRDPADRPALVGTTWTVTATTPKT